MKVSSGIPLTGILLLALTGHALAQTNYTWATGTTANWATPADWSPTSGANSPGYTGSGFSTYDRVFIGDSATNETITLDSTSTSSPTLGALNLTETSSAINVLQLGSASSTGSRILTLSSGGSAMTLGGTTADSAVFYINNTAGFANELVASSGLTINAGGELLIGNKSGTFFTTEVSTPTLTISGGDLVTTNNATASNVFISAAVNLTSGNITIANSAVTAGGIGTGTTWSSTPSGDSTMEFSGNLTATGGTIGFTAQVTSDFNSFLSLDGATNSIGAGVTLANGVIINLQGAGTQSLTVGTSGSSVATLNTLELRDSTGSANTIKQLGLAAGSTATSLSVGEITMQEGNTVSGTQYSPTRTFSMTLQLTSNLTSTVPGTGGTTALTQWFKSAGTSIVDLNGHTFDATSAFNGWIATFGTTAPAGGSEWQINSSTGTGTFKAVLFDLATNSTATTDVGIGSNVTLQATGAGTSDLGSKATTPATISSSSNFLYTGTSGSLKSTNNRTVGNVTVGNGGTSTLALASALTVGGTTGVTVTSGSTLNLATFGLSMNGSGSLNGSGNISFTSGSGITFASGATGGISAGGAGTVGTLTLTSTLPVVLTSTSNSLFDISSGSVFDQVTGGAITEAGALNVNFLGGYNPTLNQTFTLFSGGTLSGSFSSITLSDGDTGTLTGGILTITAVPEPSDLLLLGAGLLLLAIPAVRRRLVLVRL